MLGRVLDGLESREIILAWDAIRIVEYKPLSTPSALRIFTDIYKKGVQQYYDLHGDAADNFWALLTTQPTKGSKP